MLLKPEMNATLFTGPCVSSQTHHVNRVEKARQARRWSGIAVELMALAILSCACCKEVPVEQKLADCTNSSLRFQMTVDNYPPYQFVLGMPGTSGGSLDFRGEVIVSQATGTVARVPIGSDHLTWCNWLDRHGCRGFILTFGRTNHGERLATFLKRGQTYEVDVRFAEPPPPVSSLWLSSMGRAGFGPQRQVPGRPVSATDNNRP